MTVVDTTLTGWLPQMLGPAAMPGLGSGVATWLAEPTSANLAAAITDETGAGPLAFSSNTVFSGVTQLAAMRLAAESNALAGSQNDVAIGSVGHVRVTDAGAVTWTGIAGGAAGRVLLVTAIGAGGVTLKHESASSVAANRARFGGAADLVLAQDETALLIYDATSARWRGGKL